MKRTRLNSRGFIQILALMGGLAVIAGVVESSRMVNAGRQEGRGRSFKIFRKWKATM